MLTINNYNEFEAFLGKDLGVSPYHKITQEQIVQFTAIANLRGVTKATIGVELQIRGENKPAFSGQVIFLYHFID